LVLSGFSKWWESKYNISPMKFGLGLTLLGLGFDFSVWKYGINADSVVRVSMFWLIAALISYFG
jgi:POT family proton-dependent oligopeptide transporter